MDGTEDLANELSGKYPTFCLAPSPFTLTYDSVQVPAGFMIIPNGKPARDHIHWDDVAADPHVSKLLTTYRSLPVAINNSGLEGYTPRPLFTEPAAEGRKRIILVGSNSGESAQLKFETLIKNAEKLRKAHPSAQIGLVSNCHCTIKSLADACLALEDACDAIVYGPWLPQMGDGADHIVSLCKDVALDSYLRGLPVDMQMHKAVWRIFNQDLRDPNQRAHCMRAIDQMTLWELPAADQNCDTETAFQVLSTHQTSVPPAVEFNLALIDKQLHQVRRLMNSMDYDGAVALIETLLERTPDDCELLQRLGEVHLEREDYTQAEACFTKAIKASSERGQTNRLSAQAYLRRAQTRIKKGIFSTSPAEDLRAAIAQTGGTDYSLWSRYFDFEWERAPVNEGLIQAYQKVANRFMVDFPKGSKSPDNFLSRFAALQFEAGLQNAATMTLREALARNENPNAFLYMHSAIGQAAGMKPPSQSRQRSLAHVLANGAMFTELLDAADGDIAIVGNGPQELGRGQGTDIDAHNMVVRFNTYSTAFPQLHDYGAKTDLWVRMPATGYVKSDDANTCPNIMLTGVNRIYRSTGLWGWVDTQITNGHQLSFMPKEPIYELIAKLGKIPTAGLALAYMVYRETGPVDPDRIFGCSFAESPSAEMAGYHHSDAAASMGARHDFDVEHAFFQTIRRGADLSYYLPGERRALVQDISTRSIRVPQAVDQPWTLAGQTGRYDRVLSVSPGLAGYKVLGCEVEVLPRAEVRKLLGTSPAALESTPEEFSAFSAKRASRHRTLILGFGLGPTGQLGQDIAKHLGMPYMCVEYGLISSCHLPSEKQFNFSLMLDDIGAFFDTEHRSRLEMILDAGFGTETHKLTTRARALMDTVLAHDITKYNNAPPMVLPQRAKNKNGKRCPRILVIDQTSGDLSIKYGQCEVYSFQDMLDHAMARAESENAEVFFKPHPETLAGAKGANFDIEALRRRDGLTVLEENCNVMSLMPQVDEVYVMVSGVGFEALMAGKTVRCFGVPFYAGRGLTIDMVQPARPRRPLSMEEMVAAVFLQYHQFYDPDTREPVDAEACLERLIPKLPRSVAYVHDGTRARRVSLEDAAEAAAYKALRNNDVPLDLRIAADLVAVGDTVADVADGSGLVAEGLAGLGTFRVHAITENRDTLKNLRDLESDVILPRRKLKVRAEAAVTPEGMSETEEPRTDRLDGLLQGETLSLLRVATSKRTIEILETAEGLMETAPPKVVMAWLKGREFSRAASFLGQWYDAPEPLMSQNPEGDVDQAIPYLFHRRH